MKDKQSKDTPSNNNKLMKVEPREEPKEPARETDEETKKPPSIPPPPPVQPKIKHFEIQLVGVNNISQAVSELVGAKYVRQAIIQAINENLVPIYE
jgi:hypothetical protein